MAIKSKYLTRQDFEKALAQRDEIADIREMIAQCDVKTESSTQELTGMPRSSGVSDKIGNGVIEKVSLEESLRDLVYELEMEKARLTRRIMMIPNVYDRKMLTCLYVKGMTIQETADEMQTSYVAVQSRQRNFFRRLPKLKIVDPFGAYEMFGGTF